jgi:hypothetical protein
MRGTVTLVYFLKLHNEVSCSCIQFCRVEFEKSEIKCGAVLLSEQHQIAAGQDT